MEHDLQIRLAAFDWLAEQTDRHGTADPLISADSAE